MCNEAFFSSIKIFVCVESMEFWISLRGLQYFHILLQNSRSKEIFDKKSLNMERGKSGTGRGSKNKIAPHPSDFIALGSKSSRGDVQDTKRPGVGHAKSSSSSSTSSKNIHLSLLIVI